MLSLPTRMARPSGDRLGPPAAGLADSTRKPVVRPASSIGTLTSTAYTTASRIRSSRPSRCRWAVHPSRQTGTSASSSAQRQFPVAPCRSKSEIRNGSNSPMPSYPAVATACRVAPEPKPSSARPPLGISSSQTGSDGRPSQASTTTVAAAEASAVESAAVRPAIRAAAGQPRSTGVVAAARFSASAPYTSRAIRPAASTVQAVDCSQPTVMVWSAVRASPTPRASSPIRSSRYRWGGAPVLVPAARPSSRAASPARAATRADSSSAVRAVSTPPPRARQNRRAGRRPSQSAAAQSTVTVIGSSRRSEM